MGEAARRAALGMAPRGIRPGQPQQIQVDLKNATQQTCPCGCKLFIPAIHVFSVSPFAPGNNTGQELTAQQAVLVCMECKKALGAEPEGKAIEV